MLSIIAAGPDNSFKMSLRCVLVAAPVSRSAPHQGYAEDEEEPQRRGLNFLGTDVSKIPCFKHSFMYAIGSGMVTGVAYNLAFSKNPFKLACGVYTSVLFGYWFVCRYDYRSVVELP